MGSSHSPLWSIGPALRLDRRDPYLRLQNVTLFVRDQDRSLQFFVDRLGFSLVADYDVPSGDRWVASASIAVPSGGANVYLHYVFDLWIEAWRQKVATGDVIVVRYADDLVVGFENRREAERFLEAFRERLAKFGLELHPEKTRLIEFGRFAAQDREKRGEGKPETFTFLGFTHYCGKRRSNGTFIVWRKTAKKRMVAKLRALKAELRLRMHEPVADVGAWLRKVVTGYYRYHAIPGNIDRLSVFGQRLRRLWWLILRRRSQRRASWDRVARVFPQWIPAPRVLHPYPIVRFLATHPRWEPYA